MKNNEIMYAMLTNGLLDEKIKYCIEVFNELTKYNNKKEFLKVALPVARYVVQETNIEHQTINDLVEIIIIAYNDSYIMYFDRVKNCDDPEAEATTLMGIEIVKHFQ